MIRNCKSFFDHVITAFENDFDSVETLMDEKDYLLKNFYNSD